MSEESEKEKPVSRREVLKMIATGAIGLVVGAVAGYAAKPAEVVTKTVTSATTSTVTTEVTKTETATVTETVTPPAPPVVTVEKPVVKEVPTPELKVAKVIAPKPELCAGCRLCELVCALTWEGKTDPAYSRIRIKEFFGGLIVVPTVCIPCADKACIKVCPTGALSYDSKTGAIVLDETKCTKCGACFDACPAGALAPHPDTGLPMTCNKCSLCVNICPTGALEAWSKILTFEQALAKKPEEIAKDLLKKYFGVEDVKELESKYGFWTPEKAKEFGIG